MVISARLMLSQVLLRALATILPVGARMPGAMSILATATTQVLVCQTTSQAQPVESLCIIRIPLVVVQMVTILQNAQPSKTQLHVMPPMIALGQEVHVECQRVA